MENKIKKLKGANMDILIFFDVETTGIDPENNRIIEIAAVKTKKLKIIDEFHSLINPGQHISIEISKITGIDDEDVKNAPRIEEVLASFFNFIKNYPLVAHNGNFDKNFIEKASGKSIENILLDTMELACLALPTEKEHNQNALIKKFCRYTPKGHRALYDAKSLVHLYKVLIKKIRDLDSGLQSEIRHLTKDLSWPWKYFFNNKSSSQKEFRISLSTYPVRRKEEIIDIDCKVNKNKLNEERVANYFKKGGGISQVKKTFEERKEQIEMAKKITRALNQKKHLVTEAGTGIGKSLAYLIPTLLEAKINKNPVIISTHTKVLQSQLEDDVFQLKKILNWNFKPQTVKGRKNYLCLLRWFKFYRKIREEVYPIQKRIFSEEQKKEIENYEKEKLAAVFILNWMWHTKTGDLRDELSFWLQEKLSLNDLLSKITSDSNHCLGEKCPYSERYWEKKKCNATNCFVLIARYKAKDADLIIVNHALLLENKIADNDNLLPSVKQVVIDEAQHIENVATDILMNESSEKKTKELLENIYFLQKTSPGFLQIISSQIKKLKDSTLQQKLNNQIDDIIKSISRTSNSATRFFDNLKKFIEHHTPENQESNYYYSKELRLTETLRSHDDWRKLLFLETDLRENFKKIKTSLELFKNEFKKLKAHSIKNFDFSLKEIEVTIYDIGEFLNFHQEIINEPRNDFVYWLENIYFKSNEHEKGKWFSVLKSAPIEVGKELEEKFYNQIESIIFTSATLTIDNSFEFIKLRLGFNFLPLSKVIYQQLFSPFDYLRQVLFIIVSDLPDYSDSYKKDKGKNFFRAVNEVIPEIIKKNRGGVLILCTSHEQIDLLHPRCRSALEKQNKQVLRQQKGMSTKRKIECFREDRDSVIFGTYSLWEGIDVPGESLNFLVMVKLPFDSPKRPLVEARKISMDLKGRDGMKDYYYPLAIMRLKQGFGRLIRNTTDRGIFVIFDKRLKNSKRYSDQFLNSLPHPINKTHKYLPLKESLDEIEKFYSEYNVNSSSGKQVEIKKKCYIQKDPANSKLDNAHPRIRRKYPRAYEKWEDEEDRELAGLFGKDVSISELASYFQRQPNAIGSRIRKLDLK